MKFSDIEMLSWRLIFLSISLLVFLGKVFFKFFCHFHEVLNSFSEKANAKSIKCVRIPCQPPEGGCGRGKFWNYKTCSCKVGCDFIKKCPNKDEKWDIFKCRCVIACPGVSCDQVTTILDVENCQCVVEE